MTEDKGVAAIIASSIGRALGKKFVEEVLMRPPTSKRASIFDCPSVPDEEKEKLALEGKVGEIKEKLNLEGDNTAGKEKQYLEGKVGETKEKLNLEGDTEGKEKQYLGRKEQNEMGFGKRRQKHGGLFDEYSVGLCTEKYRLFVACHFPNAERA